MTRYTIDKYPNGTVIEKRVRDYGVAENIGFFKGENADGFAGAFCEILNVLAEIADAVTQKRGSE